MRNLSYENEFCMQFHFHANQSHFLKNGFTLRLALKQRHKGTRKWPISFTVVKFVRIHIELKAFFFSSCRREAVEIRTGLHGLKKYLCARQTSPILKSLNYEFER